jgi:hypothetical protein
MLERFVSRCSRREMIETAPIGAVSIGRAVSSCEMAAA